jgi:calcium-dependent protein kinase
MVEAQKVSGSHLTSQISLEDKQKLIIKTVNLIKKQYREAFEENYEVEEQIGEGGFGQVFKLRHKPSGKFYAGKTIQLNTLDQQSSSYAEIEAMKKLDHPNLIKLYEYFEMDSE